MDTAAVGTAVVGIHLAEGSSPVEGSRPEGGTRLVGDTYPVEGSHPAVVGSTPVVGSLVAHTLVVGTLARAPAVTLGMPADTRLAVAVRTRLVLCRLVDTHAVSCTPVASQQVPCRDKNPYRRTWTE